MPTKQTVSKQVDSFRLIFGKLPKNLSERGCFVKQRHAFETRGTEHTVAVFARVLKDPHISIRQLEMESDIPYSSIQRRLKDNELHPQKPLSFLQNNLTLFIFY